MSLHPNPLFDPVLWMVLGGIFVVFVAPAIAILLALDLFEKYMRRRMWARRRARGFDVGLKAKPTTLERRDASGDC